MSQREIKLRVWEFARPKDGFKGAMTYIGWTQDYSVWFLRYCFKPENKDAYTIMQFTGLKDKNGKEVYEGDYVVRHLTDGSYGGSVVWDAVSLRWKVAGQEYISSGTYEVIGNIYENAELLE